MRTTLGVASLLGLLSAASASAGGAASRPSSSPLRLSAADQHRILEQLCQAQNAGESGQDANAGWVLAQDQRGWLCRNRQPPDEWPFSSELRWASARRGRFVAAEGEWLVSLQGGCEQGCRGSTAILQREGQGWQVLHQEDTLVTDECVVLRAPDGFDHVACLAGSGPFQGFMIDALEVSAFATGRSQRLLYKEHGGECYLAQPPTPAEHDRDRLSGLSTSDSTSGAALSVRLQVRRLGCEVQTDDVDSLAQVRAEHVLSFVWRGQELAPDTVSAELIRRHGWAESP